MPRGGGGGGGRGSRGKFGHKGGNRHFTNYEELQRQQKEIEAEKAARELEEDGEGGEGGSAAPVKRIVKFKTKKADGEEESSSSESDSDSDSSDGGKAPIATHNPNLVSNKMKKIKDLTLEEVAKPQLNRKEREALEAERKKAAYQKLHAEGKTDEAKADMERLRLIRMQREDAARKREAEKTAKETAKANTPATQFKKTDKAGKKK